MLVAPVSASKVEREVSIAAALGSIVHMRIGSDSDYALTKQ